MEPEGIHDLTAAYALDALDENDAGEFERHLRHCPRCRAELTELREVTTALAYAAPPAPAPEGLRERILEGARADRGKVNPLPARGRRWTPVLAAATAVAAAAAVALGIWAAVLNRDLDQERSARARDAEALALFAAPGTTRVPLNGANGSLAVGSSGQAVLVISTLRAAPKGKTYEAWVITGTTPVPAGLFQGGRNTVVKLSRPVAAGATVAVTVERRGGAAKPTQAPIMSAQLS